MFSNSGATNADIEISAEMLCFYTWPTFRIERSALGVIFAWCQLFSYRWFVFLWVGLHFGLHKGVCSFFWLCASLQTFNDLQSCCDVSHQSVFIVCHYLEPGTPLQVTHPILVIPDIHSFPCCAINVEHLTLIQIQYVGTAHKLHFAGDQQGNKAFINTQHLNLLLFMHIPRT